MKKRYLLFAILLLIPLNAKAYEIKLECDKTTAAPKSEVNCSVVGYDTHVSAVGGTVSVQNGTVKKVTKNQCNFGIVEETEFDCIHDITPTKLNAVTYTIEVGASGTTTFGLTSPKLVGYEYRDDDSDTITVEPVRITISSTSPVNPDPTPVNPTPTDPEPTPTDPEPTPSNPTEPGKQEQTTPATPTEQKSTEKENIKNPDTGAFLNTTLVLIALGCASYIAYRVVKKQKFFRL